MIGWPEGARYEGYDVDRNALDDPWHTLEGRPTPWAAFPGQPAPSGWRVLGFGYFVAAYHQPNGQTELYRFWRMPVWPLILVLMMPAHHIRRVLRKRDRLRLGLCADCGYDLRGSAGRCPECGKPVDVRNVDSPDAGTRSAVLRKR